MARKTKFKIIIHNANGIFDDRLCKHELLHSLDVDIALISETCSKFHRGFSGGFQDTEFIIH